jgi:PleD family two-component response regulator
MNSESDNQVPSPAPTFPRKLRVVVVEDSPLYRSIIRGVLSRDSYEIHFASTKGEGVELYDTIHPELILTDWNLPDGTGLELCKHVRTTLGDTYPYVVLLTAQSDKNDVVRALAACADDYLTKPFHDGELLARLAAGRRIVELQRDLQAKNKLLEELALTDALTGLPNRRAIEQIANSAMSAGSRHDFPVWIALADLDRFKAINDAYGHDLGDQVLRGFAEILSMNT